LRGQRSSDNSYSTKATNRARNSWKTDQIARKPDTRNDWSDFNASDPGLALLELLSYLGELLGSRQDAVAAEQRLRSRRYALAIGALALALFIWWRNTDSADHN
jgi:hypothetical protein